MATIKEQFAEELKDAMKTGDVDRRDVIRMVESEISLAKSAPGFKGEVNDDLYRQVICQLFEEDGQGPGRVSRSRASGEEMARKLGWEVDYLSRWLPTKLDQAVNRSPGEGDHFRARRRRRSQGGGQGDRSDHEEPQGRGRRRPRQPPGGRRAERPESSLKPRATFTRSTTGIESTSARGTHLASTVLPPTS